MFYYRGKNDCCATNVLRKCIQDLKMHLHKVFVYTVNRVFYSISIHIISYNTQYLAAACYT